MNKIFVNVETGETQIVPLTQEEIDEFAVRYAEDEAMELEMQEKEEAKAAAKSNARAKLAAVGLTEDEIAAMVGI